MDSEESSPGGSCSGSTASPASVEVKEADQTVQTSPSKSDVTLSQTRSQSSTSEDVREVKPKHSPVKVDILLKPAGDAPIMKTQKWAVDRSKKISWVASFIKKYIKSDASESLFLYVNQSFAPSLDTDIGTIFECFGSDGKLVLHYCKTQAWG